MNKEIVSTIGPVPVHVVGLSGVIVRVMVTLPT